MKDWVGGRVGGVTTVQMHSGCALKMAAFQVLLRRGRNLDKILHRSCRLDNKISWNIRCIHQGNIHAFKLEQRMLGKVRFTIKLRQGQKSDRINSDR